MYAFATLFLLTQSCTTPERDVFQKHSISRKGMVVTAHYLATQVGLDILQQGGNAVDAAIAVQFALAVVFPRAGNIGGGGFLVYRNSEGLVQSLDFREKAPSDAYRDMFLSDSTESVMESGLAVGIPGTVAGMWEMYHSLKPNLAFGDLLQPAIELAREGFAITEAEAERLNKFKQLFQDNNDYPIPFVKETKWVTGDLLRQTELANMLERIADEGADAFYKGGNAIYLTQAVRNLSGIIRIQDLSSYKPIWRDAVSSTYKKYTIHSMAPPSSGGLTLIQILKMIEPFSLEMNAWDSAYNIHLVVEASKRAFANRATFLGDPDFVAIDQNKLLSTAFLTNQMLEYNPNFASDVKAIDRNLPAASPKEHYETTHFSIVDAAGNAVAITTTLNSNYGSGIFVKEGGYFLNNQMDDFSMAPGVPNQYGLVGAEANAIEGNKRMLSSMSPTIIEEDGALFMVLGAPGGPTIISSVLLVFLNVAEFELPLAEAVANRRFHHQYLPDEIVVEDMDWNPEVLKSLEERGHKIRKITSMGAIAAIRVLQDKTLEGAADPRDESHAQGL
ncbi:MAG: gamma-glutamyltransferase [Saprospiraceae bacterium]|nr:gamma-glutamyltransferase [Saprospiraceae bacterium]